MPATLTLAYPVQEPRFDHAYHAGTHLPLVLEVFKPFGLEDAAASRGIDAGPDRLAPFHVVTVLTFPDMEALQRALAGGERVLADIPNYYRGTPVMMVGETLL